MKLNELIYDSSADGVDIERIEIDVDKVKEGDLFFSFYGNDIERALEKGAAAVVAEYGVNSDNAVKVRDIRKTYALASARLCGNVHEKLKLIAVVGTNGKSTTAYLVYETLRRNGYNIGIIGTGFYAYRDIRKEQPMTTPDPHIFHSILNEMYDSGVEYVVSEVSAHAIELKKVYGIKFQIGIFTSFSQDHLDYFGNMERYKSVKKSFFNHTHIRCAVVNIDDTCGAEIASKCDVPCVTYGLSAPADTFAIDIACDISGSDFVVNVLDEIYDMHTELAGKFNIYNVLGAVTALKCLGVPLEDAAAALAAIPPLEGRCNVIRKNGVAYVIDYAHTPDGLAKILSEMRKLTKGKLRVVFGCGGDRDKSKRKPMGETANKYCDEVIITCDNPRGEDSLAIMREIALGVSSGKRKLISDRSEAVKYSVLKSVSGDTVVIAGKGAENYIEERGVKIAYSDRDELLSALEEKYDD